MKKFIVIILIAVLVFSACKQENYIFTKIGKPSKTWVGKIIKLKFGPKNNNDLKNIEVIVKIKSAVQIKKSTIWVFHTVKAYTKKGHDYLYFSWFGSKSKPQIISWMEAKKM